MSDAPPGRTRVGVYAVAVHRGSVLLTLLHRSDPDGGRWTLPGGGLDFGEQPEEGLHREVYEETGLSGEITGFLGVDSHLIDPHPEHARLHAVQLVYGMRLRGTPRVIEVEGSTIDARWVPLVDLPRLRCVPLVEFGLRTYGVD